MDLNVSIKDAAIISGKGTYFVRNAIASGKMPGIHVSKGNRRTFSIPKKALLDYLHMTEAEADEILAKKRDTATDQSTVSQS